MIALGRLASAVVIGALAAAAVTIPAPVAVAAVDDRTGVEAVGLPFEPTIRGGGGQVSVTVTVPTGAIPVRLSGNVVSTYTEEGSILITVNDAVVAEQPAAVGGPVSVPLSEEDLVDGSVVIGLRASLQPQEDCFVDDRSTATLREGAITYRYPLSPPSTVGEFLSPGVAEYTVQIPREATPAELEAGLNAVAALSHRFDAPTVINLVGSDAPPRDQFFRRTLLVKADDRPEAAASGGVLQVIPIGNMMLTGPSDALVGVAFALADDALSLVDGARLQQVSGTPEWSPAAGPTSLSGLGVGRVSMTGIGQVESTIGIGQPAFGRPVSAVTIDLEGAITPLPENGVGRVDLQWNGVLIDSIAMSNSTEFAAQIIIDADQMQRDNVLAVTLSFVPPSGGCALRSLPARLDLDPRRSVVTPTYGNGLEPGFERFPQTLGSTVPVVLGPLGTPTSVIAQAGDLVAGLQSLSPEQLTVVVQSTDEYRDSGRSGIVVGADEATVAALNAPFAIGDLIQVGAPAPTFVAQIPGPLALAAAFADDERDTAVLFPVPTDTDADAHTAATALTNRFAETVASGPGRWAQLTGQVMSLGATGQLDGIRLLQPSPTDDPVPNRGGFDTRTEVAIVLLLAAIAILLLLLLWWVVRARLRRESAQRGDGGAEDPDDAPEEPADPAPDGPDEGPPGGDPSADAADADVEAEQMPTDDAPVDEAPAAVAVVDPVVADLPVAAIVPIVVAAAAESPPAIEPPAEVERAVVVRRHEVAFNVGSPKLKKAGRRALITAVAGVPASALVESVTVESTRTAGMSKADKRLAKERTAAVVTALTDIDVHPEVRKVRGGHGPAAPVTVELRYLD